MDRLQAMTTFVAVVDSGGFASAARKLNLSPPVVTRAVAELEERLGLRLLTRTTRIVRVTDAGARFAEDCRRILGDIEEAETAATGTNAAPRGTLTLTAPVLFGHLYVTPILVDYLQRFPEVDAQCLFLDRIVNVVEEGIDVAVRIGELADSTLVARRVGTTQRALVASPGYLRSLPKGARAPRVPDDLLQLNCIVYTELATQNAWTFTAGPGAPAAVGTSVTVRAQGNIQTNSSEVVRAAVLSGMGVGYAPTWLFDEEMSQGDLQVLLPDWPAPPMPVHLVSPSQRRESAKVRAFAEHLVAAGR
jgi:DNA-binding transcriptional LysR family regulator